MPLILTGDVYVFLSEKTFSAKDLQSDVLRIDERYQRVEIKDKVRDLIQVLEAGGRIPDPAWISQRPDKSLWIVDGQQRFWAHWHTSTPFTGRVHAVPDWHTEAVIFHQLNDRSGHASAHRAYTWPGAAGDVVRWADNHKESPLCGEIGKSTRDRLPASTFAKALYAALTGQNPQTNIKSVMGRLDLVLQHNPRRGQKTTQMFAVVMRQVFPEHRVLTLPPRALGCLCFEHWDGLAVKAAWPMPAPRQVARLRAIRWDRLVETQHHRYLPTVMEAIRKVWSPGKKAAA